MPGSNYSGCSLYHPVKANLGELYARFYASIVFHPAILVVQLHIDPLFWFLLLLIYFSPLTLVFFVLLPTLSCFYIAYAVFADMQRRLNGSHYQRRRPIVECLVLFCGATAAWSRCSAAIHPRRNVHRRECLQEDVVRVFRYDVTRFITRHLQVHRPQNPCTRLNL